MKEEEEEEEEEEGVSLLSYLLHLGHATTAGGVKGGRKMRSAVALNFS